MAVPRNETGMTVLDIAPTVKCNMDCSFCKGSVYMQRNDAAAEVQSDTMVKAIEEHKEIKNFVWGGGEPLLALKRVKEMVALARELKPDAAHQFLTNGRKLRLTHVDYLKSFERVTVSIDGYEQGERTLMGFVDDGAYEALEAIAALDNIDTWSVVTNKQFWNPRWHEDIIKLHNAIHHLGFKSFGILFDKRMEEELFTDQVLNFTFGYKQIRDNVERLNKLHCSHTVLHVPNFFTHYACNNCSELGRVEPDGNFKRDENVEWVVDVGCNMLAARMGKAAYNYINRFLKPEKVE